jgi:hypothetical protein
MPNKLSIVSFALATLTTFAASAAPAAQDHHCKLPDGSFDGGKTEKQCADAKGSWVKDATFTGTLETGVAAIGGETTGIAIEISATQSYELELRDDKGLSAAADQLKNKQVTVVGYLTTKRGVEIRERHIIVVTSLKAAEPGAKK